MTQNEFTIKELIELFESKTKNRKISLKDYNEIFSDKRFTKKLSVSEKKELSQFDIPMSEARKVVKKVMAQLLKVGQLQDEINKLNSITYKYVDKEKKRIQDIFKLVEQQKFIENSAKLVEKDFTKFKRSINKLIK